MRLPPPMQSSLEGSRCQPADHHLERGLPTSAPDPLTARDAPAMRQVTQCRVAGTATSDPDTQQRQPGRPDNERDRDGADFAEAIVLGSDMSFASCSGRVVSSRGRSRSPANGCDRRCATAAPGTQDLDIPSRTSIQTVPGGQPARHPGHRLLVASAGKPRRAGLRL